tara:strand:+ start:662 stop:1816 length:1155 start_codon:yes stop_codon:yes gene_type:complete
MKSYFKALATLCASSTALHAGGWETGTLPTAMMYEDGNYAELSYGSLTYNLDGSTSTFDENNALAALPGSTETGPVKHKMAKNQTRSSIAAKFSVGSYDFGISNFDSGAIKLDGTNSTVTTKTASADINLKTTAVQVNRALDGGFNFGLGMRQLELGSGTVSTLAGVTYSIDSASTSSIIASAAYEMPEIAMRAELVYEGSAKIDFTHTLSGNAAGTAATGGTLSIPQATTLNVQTGIAEGTLLFGTIRNVAWGSSQVIATTNFAAYDISSEFEDTTKYNIGIGRKFSDALSGSLSYSQEAASSSKSTSGFTLTDGYRSVSAGIKYTMEKINVSVGYSYVMPGDVTVTHDFTVGDPRRGAGNSTQTVYKNSTIQGLGVKVGVNF